MVSNPPPLSPGLRHTQPNTGRELLLILLGVLAVLSPFFLRVQKTLGGLEFPLDDTYIYLQYARNLAHGHLFEYWPGDGYTAGSTSFLYPFWLVPGFWMGLDDAALVPYVWCLNALLIFSSAVLAARLGRYFAGPAGAIGAAGLLLVQGSWLWGALSGLETGLFTTLVLLSAWRLVRDSENLPPEPHASTPGDVALWVTAAAIAITRPEGLPISLVLVACTLLRAGRRNRPLSWWPALLVLVPFLAFSAANLTFVGQTVPNTALHKSVLYFPRQSVEHVLEHMLTQLGRVVLRASAFPTPRMLVPLGAVTLLLAGGWLGWRVRREARERQAFPATFLLLAILAGAGAASVAKGPGQVHRYYHIPLALITVCAGIALGTLMNLARARMRPLHFRLAVVAVGGSIAALAVHQLDGWSAHYVDATEEIRNQQVKTARWMASKLPANAYVLLNDVGAMTYLAKRRSFDVCGLTTNHQSRAMSEGPGAIFERLEHLSPQARPTHLAIYPHWVGIPFIQGRELYKTVLSGHRVVAGGPTVKIFKADWRSLGSGALPIHVLSATPQTFGAVRPVLDSLDVSDLEDETAHGYQLEVPAKQRGALRTTLAVKHRTPQGIEVADGGREVVRRESFDVMLPDVREAALRIRLEPLKKAALKVQINGQALGELTVPAHKGFVEVEMALPRAFWAVGQQRISVEATFGASYRVFHYWIVGE